jgi:serpin B
MDAPNGGGGGGESIGDIIKNTIQLLDSLDRRLDAATNRTGVAPANRTTSQAAPAQQGSDEELRLTSWAEGFASERRPAGDDGRADLEPLVAAPSSESAAQQQQQHQQSAGGSIKRTRQLTGLDEVRPTATAAAAIATTTTTGQQLARFTDNDFTEKHISFSLDLMRAVFASQYRSRTSAIDSFLISPVSIQMVLMMMHLGSSGQTRRELDNCLHLVAATTTTGQLKEEAGKPSNGSATATNSAATTTANQQSRSAKLSRRHQQPAAAAVQASGGPKQHVQTQQRQAGAAKQPTASGSNNNYNNVHEQFGSAMRQLLKDQTVVKALSSANQIFVQKDLPLAAHYEWAVKNYYGTDLKAVDFQNQNLEQQPSNRSAANSSSNIQLMINEWVERQTRGKISQLLSAPVPSSTLLMALNVLFFKGDWQYKFDPADTEPEAWFTLTNGRTARVPMMVNKLPLAHAHDPGMKASLIELPYKAQRLGLFILLPDEMDGIFDTMRSLSPSSFANLISMMRKPSSGAGAGAQADPHANGINVRIPKFTIESSPKMSQILSQQLGLKSLFAADLADLSGMFAAGQRRPPVQVGLDELLHKAVLQVHEQGSVAAAASATIVERVGTYNGQYFEADHPFLLFLMDKQTGLVLFAGVFAGPPGSGGADGVAAGQQQPGADQSGGQPSSSNNNSSSLPEGGAAGGHQHPAASSRAQKQSQP